MINRLITWERAFDKPSKRIAFKVFFHSLSNNEVEGLEALLLPVNLPFSPATVDVHLGNETPYASLKEPWQFALQHLKQGRAVIVNAERTDSADVPEYFSISLREDEKEGHLRGILSYYVEDGPIIHELRSRIIDLFTVHRVGQAFYYAQDYFDLIQKRHYRNYRYKKGLKTFVNTHGERMVDITQRPGVSTRLKQGYAFCGAAEYWFGPAFFQLVPKDRILAFPHAIQVEEVRPDLVYVRLFDTVFAGLKPEEVALHQAFRDYLGIDELKLT